MSIQSPMRYPKPANFKPEPRFPDDHPRWPGGNRCQSWNPNQGRQCNAPAMHHRIRCQSHGGETPRGLANPNTKTGIYSKDLPTKLSASYQDLLSLGDRLWQIADEAAAITALTQQALSGIDNGESGAAWRRIADLHRQMEAINRKANQTEDDMSKWASAFEEIGQISRHKSMSYAARDEATRLMNLKRQFISDERKARTEAHKVMTYEQTMLLLVAVVNSFKQALEKHVDSDTRNKILIEGQKVVSKVLNEH